MQIDPSTLSRRHVHHLMISAIVPRPVAFVSTCDASGRTNAAPFSFFTGVASSPPSLLICTSRRREGPKDTERNIIETGEFVVNVVVPGIMDAVVIAGGDYPPEISEVDLAGLKTAPAVKVKPPILVESPVSLECRLLKAIEAAGAAIIVGEVVWIHVRDDLLIPDGDSGPGVIDAGRLQPIARLGGDLYTTLGTIFERARK